MLRNCGTITFSFSSIHILVTFNDDTTPASEVTINTNEFIILESNTSYYLGNGLVQIFYLKESDAI